MAMYGKWRVVKELGKGGQGTAYLANDTLKWNLEAMKRMLQKDIPQITAIHFAEEKMDAAERA